MKHTLILFAHLLITLIKLVLPGGAKAVIAENLLLKHQLLVNNRSRNRAPNLSPLDRFVFGFCSLFVNVKRINKLAVVIQPSTLLSFHKALVKRKYHLLFTPLNRNKPGPKGPPKELIKAIVEMKQRNPRYGCPRIAQQINKAFGTDIDKDVVRRVLEKYYRPNSGPNGPSWLTFLGQTKDSLWSVDLFRCESILLRSHWVLVVMDQYTRRIVGFGIHAGYVDGTALCCMFNKIISHKKRPQHLSSDNDPLFHYQRWQANLRILDIEEIKTVPYVPISHPFVERLIGTIRREFLDHTLFWNTYDLEEKLQAFQNYYNEYRVHTSLNGESPADTDQRTTKPKADLYNHHWQSHCRGLYQLPAAA